MNEESLRMGRRLCGRVRGCGGGTGSGAMGREVGAGTVGVRRMVVSSLWGVWCLVFGARLVSLFLVFLVS